MTSRSRQRKIKAAMETQNKAEIRRVRRGRVSNTQAGKGHGKPRYEPVMSSSTKQDSKDVDRAITKVVKELFGG